MGLTDEIRSACAQEAAGTEHVSIDLDACAEIRPAPSPALDPEIHYLEGEPADIADYMLALDAINFGSGWFPTLRKRSAGCGPGRGSRRARAAPGRSPGARWTSSPKPAGRPSA